MLHTHGVRWSRRVIAIGWLLATSSVYAGNATLYATATGDVAATDNVFAAPSGGDREADLFTQVRPGGLFAYDAPRMIQELSAAVEILEYLLHSPEPSITFFGGWRALLLPGPRSQVTLTANAGTGVLNALTSRSSPDQTVIAVTPTGDTTLHQADAAEDLSWTSSQETRTSQTIFARWATTDDNEPMPSTTSSFEAGAAVGFERTFGHDSVGINVGASFLRLELIAPPGSIPGSRLDRQINPRATATWRHDINRQWSVNLDGGVVYVDPVGIDPYNPTTPQIAAPFPIFGALVAYTEAWGRATLSARRTVSPDLYIAENTVDDSIVAQVALPLPWLDDNPHLRAPKLVALGSIGVERTQLVDPTTGDLAGTFDLAHLDVGVAWTPHPGRTFGLRYEFVYQNADAIAVATAGAQSYFRDTLYFTFALQYPDRMRQSSIPKQSDSVRADRKDLAPVGAEPVVPDSIDPTGSSGDD